MATALIAAALSLAACGSPARAPNGMAEELTATVDAWRERTPVPGVVAIIAAGDGDQQILASGTLNRGGRKSVTADTRFRAASITKLLVATVVMQLEREKLLSLDDPVAGHVTKGVSIAELLEEVTIRDLLAHTSGLPDAGRSPELQRLLVEHPDRAWNFDDVLALTARSSLEFSPGSAYGYSNSNYLLLGSVIEAVTGRPWHVEVRERILDPVGMTASYIAGFEEPTGRLAPGYFDLDNDGFTEKIADPWPALETSEGAAGALVANAPDLIRFMQAFAGGRLVPKNVVEEMTTRGVHSSRYTGYGLGVEILRPDLQTTVWGHGGFVPGHRAILWHAPVKHLTVVVLTNESRSRPDGLAELLLRIASG
jgi:D-alanyl-D-alanine carboxypeptidase